MKNIISLVLLLTIPTQSFAATQAAKKPGAFDCAVEWKDVRAVFKVSPNGMSKLFVSHKGKSYVCSVSTLYTHVEPNSHAAAYRSKHTLEKCDPELSNVLGKELRPSFFLNISTFTKPPTGHLQWLKFEQPSKCSLMGFDLRSWRDLLKSQEGASILGH